jgi:hypothetical protein
MLVQEDVKSLITFFQAMLHLLTFEYHKTFRAIGF